MSSSEEATASTQGDSTLLLSGARWFMLSVEGWMFLAWRPCQLEPPAAAAVMEAPLTGSPLPRGQRCHQRATRAPPPLVPFQANRYIMRLLVLCPCSIKAPSLQMCCPRVVAPACLHVYCQFYFTYANFNFRALFTCNVKVRFVCCSDVYHGKTVIKQCLERLSRHYIFAPGVDSGSQGK